MMEKSVHGDVRARLQEWPGGIPVHLRSMVVWWEGLRRRWSRMRRSLTEIEQVFLMISNLLKLWYFH